METVEQIVAKLQKSAQLITRQRVSRYYKDLSGLTQSYNEVTGLIHAVIQQYQTPSARRARELLIERSRDPYVWREQVIANALHEITEQHRSEIHEAILASRLPGKSPIRKRPKRRTPGTYRSRVSRDLQPAEPEDAVAYAQADDVDEGHDESQGQLTE
jgi:hypothetical protein